MRPPHVHEPLRIHRYWKFAARLEVALESRDSTIKLWDAQTGQERTTLKGHSDVLSLTFSGDGHTLVSASQELIKVWDVYSGQVRLTLGGDFLAGSSMNFSVEGNTLAVPHQRTIKLWDLQ